MRHQRKHRNPAAGRPVYRLTDRERAIIGIVRLIALKYVDNAEIQVGDDGQVFICSMVNGPVKDRFKP